MDREFILDNLKSLISESFEVDAASLTPETTQADLGIDSILMVDLMMNVEERLDVTLKNLDLPRNPSLNDIVDLIEANNGAAAEQ